MADILTEAGNFLTTETGFGIIFTEAGGGVAAVLDEAGGGILDEAGGGITEEAGGGGPTPAVLAAPASFPPATVTATSRNITAAPAVLAAPAAFPPATVTAIVVQPGEGITVADSLILGGVIELLAGGENVSELAQCAGVVFTLGGADESEYSLGTPQAVADLNASLLLDGERPYGRRASNRTISLPVMLKAQDPALTGAERARLLAAGREALLQIADADTVTLTWTRTGGKPMIIDCFRAGESAVSYSFIDAEAGLARVMLTFTALPYGRSDELAVFEFPAPEGGTTQWPTPPSPVTIDDYTAVSSTTQPSWWGQRDGYTTGSKAAWWDWSISDNDSCPIYTHTVTSKDISGGQDKLAFWLGAQTENYDDWHKGNVSVSITLQDSGAHSLTFGTTVWLTATDGVGVSNPPTWSKVSVGIPQGTAGFDYAHVTGYVIKVWRYRDSSGDLRMKENVYLSGLSAVPTASVPAQPPVTSRGAVYNLQGVLGSARSPVRVQANLPTSLDPLILTAYKTMIVHRPGPDAPATLAPLIAVGGGADPPDGRNYTATSPVAGLNARYTGTYTAVLTAYTWNNPGNPRTVTLKIRQYPYSGGTAKDFTLSRTVTPSSDIVNGITVMGEVTLPLTDIPGDNAEAYFAVTVTSGNTADRFYDLLLLDTGGQTVAVNSPTETFQNFWIDEPDPPADLGRILGANGGRSRAKSLLEYAMAVSGGPMRVDPGDLWILVYSPQGAPAVTASYYPRWRTDRID